MSLGVVIRGKTINVIALPASLEILTPSMLGGRRCIASDDVHHDEALVTPDRVLANPLTLSKMGATGELDDWYSEMALFTVQVAHHSRWWGSGKRPDGRLFYMISPETRDEEKARATARKKKR